MPRLKNLLHEQFAHEYVLCGVTAEAYRRTRKVFSWQSYKPESAKVNGYAILNRAGVRERIDEMRADMAKVADVTRDKLVSDTQEAMNLARLLQKPGEMISAVMAQAKICGLLTDRSEVVHLDGAEPQTAEEVLARIRDKLGDEAASTLAKAFGLPEIEAVKEKGRAAPNPFMDQTPPSDAVN